MDFSSLLSMQLLQTGCSVLGLLQARLHVQDEAILSVMTANSKQVQGLLSSSLYQDDLQDYFASTLSPMSSLFQGRIITYGLFVVLSLACMPFHVATASYQLTTFPALHHSSPSPQC